MRTIQTYCCKEHLVEQTEFGNRLEKPVKEIPILEAEKLKLVCTFCLMGGIVTYADCKIETEVS